MRLRGPSFKQDSDMMNNAHATPAADSLIMMISWHVTVTNLRVSFLTDDMPKGP